MQGKEDEVQPNAPEPLNQANQEGRLLSIVARGGPGVLVGDAIFNIDFPRLGNSVVEHLVYNQGAWVQSPVWPYS
jgi:hypothetical protein